MIMRPIQHGFTLIELMITVTVVGVLAAIAYPSYQNAMVKNRRASAQSFLSDVAQRQQQYLIDSRSFASSLSALNLTISPEVGSYYTVTFEVGTATLPVFTVTAAPLTGSPQASDGALSLNSSGVKSPTGKW